MISTTSWILDVLLKEPSLGDTGNHRLISTSIHRSSNPKLPSANSTKEAIQSSSADLKSSSTTKEKQRVILDYVIPRLRKGIDYLNSRDIDDDALLEQNHNEDWMDTVLRAGKIVYSQACCILALKDFASVLTQVGRDSDARHMIKLADETISAVEHRLWSQQDGCYIDVQESHHIGGPYKTLTQDTSLYLIGITENTHDDKTKGTRYKSHIQTNDPREMRAKSTLDAIKSRIWKDKWPLITEADLMSTGPWVLKPYFYHNHTFWPWATGIEMLARSRFDRVEECNILLSKLASENEPHPHAFYEWVNPNTGKGDGAYPFRTGISAVRIAIADIFWRNSQKNE